MSELTYYNLYRKYKTKYLNLFNQIGGNGKKIVIFRSSTATDVFPEDTAFQNMLKEATRVDDVDFYEVSSLRQLADIFKHYKSGQVVQMIIQGHGSQDELIIGTDNIKIGTPLWENFVGFIRNELIPRLASINGSVFIHSCSIASEKSGQKSFARRASEALGASVLYGATGDVKMFDIELTASGVTGVSYKIVSEKQNPDYQIKAFTDGNDFDQEMEFLKLVGLIQLDKEGRYHCEDNRRCVQDPEGEYSNYDSCIANCFDD